jgi:hypothetical protein
MIYLTYDLPPPANITNMFGKWLNGVNKNDKALIRIGISTVCWSIWTTRNDIIFYRQKGLIFCRLSDKQHTGFSNGLFFSRRISGRLWLLGATSYPGLLFLG